MAGLYSNASGSIFCFFASYDEEQGHATPSGGLSLSFDERTNPLVILGLRANPTTYSLSGGVSGTTLLRNGTPVNLNADGIRRQDLQALPAIWSALRSDSAITAAQVRTLLRFILRQLYQDN